MDLPIYIFNRIWRPQYLFLAVVLTFCVFYVIIHSNAKTSDGIVLSAAATKGSSDKKSNGKQNEIVLPITDYEIKQRGFKDKIENKNQIDKPLESKRSSVRSMVENNPKYYDDDLRPNWTFKITKNYGKQFLHRWNKPIEFVNRKKVLGQGENGAAFKPSQSDTKRMKALLQKHNYNLLATERISLHRTLPDYRFPECRNITYPELLPKTSVIIVIHDEAWSNVWRTVWSIIDRSPLELIEDIILVDDASSWSYLKQPLADYAKLLPVRTQVIRTDKREGLIRARLIGAKRAKGSILTFFDAHMECTEGWLQPILSRIASDRSVVVVPNIDAIVSSDMSYSASSKVSLVGLRWHLTFYWMDVPARELLRTKNDKTAPVRTPSHVGCGFSIDREFFFEIGSYDVGMNIWGSENVELAFRVWLCGGALEILPCSRVGHLYRISTYSFGDENPDIIKRQNNKRVVEVWMDEYKQLFFAQSPDTARVSAGNISQRIHLKNQLKCKNFRWYLDNVYPESGFRKEYVFMGEVKSVSEKVCLDIYTTSLHGKLILNWCHKMGGNQFFAFAKSGQIVTVEELCVGVANQTVILVKCSESDKSQLWRFNVEKKWIVHRKSNQCMRNNKRFVSIDECNSYDTRFKWRIHSALKHPSEKKPIEFKQREHIKQFEDPDLFK